MNSRLRTLVSNQDLDSLWRVPGWIRELGRKDSPLGLPLYLVGIAIWLLRRDYDGIRHDAMFYMGQTLVRMGDPNIARDLFFQYGSQDQYTIFSPMMAVLVRTFGFVGASLGTVVASQIAFLAAATLLLLEFAPLSLVGVGIAYCAMTPFYGPFNIFSIGEPFTTARSLAEPLLLFSVYAMLKGRHLTCILLLGIGSVMHPLLAVPIWCVLIAMAWTDLPQYRRVLLATMAAGLVLFVVAASLRPEFFFSFYDDEWWAIVTEHTAQVSMRLWGLKDWTLIAVDLAVPLLLARTLEAGPLKRLLCLAALVLAWALFISAWGSDMLRSVFLTEIQIWRAEAFAHLLAVGLFPYLLWQMRGNGMATLVGGLFIILGIDYQSTYENAAIAVPAGILLLAVAQYIGKPTMGMKLLVAAFVLIALGAGLYNEIDIALYYAARAQTFSLDLLLHKFSATWTVAFGVLAGVALLASRSRTAGLVVSLALVVLMAGLWDNRTPFQDALEGRLGQPPLAADLIHPGQTVYWSDDLRLPWFILDRASFYSRNQSAGLVFKRETAIEFARREDWILPMTSSQETCGQMLTLVGRSCTLAREAVTDVCAVGGPDFLLSALPVEDLKPVRELSLAVKGSPPAKWAIFACDDVRRQMNLLEHAGHDRLPAAKTAVKS